MGTPEFSVSVLDALVLAGHEVVCVYSQPPRRAGRGKSERKTPVHQRAEELGLEVRTPLNFKDPLEVDRLEKLNADIAVVVAYGLLLPQTVLDAPAQGCLNIHASLLPRWRGAAPIQRAIMEGDATSGVCIIQMDAGLDTGPVRLRHETVITDQDTYASLHDRLAELGAKAIVEALENLADLPPVTQSQAGVTYAKKIDKAEARIDWSKPAVEVDRLIRGLSPFPGAWSELNGERIKFLMSSLEQGAGNPGETLDDALTIATGQDAVRVHQLQRAGKSAADAKTVLRGFPIPTGSQFR